MSQRDLVAELRGARIAAPAHVREHVRQIVAGAPPRRAGSPGAARSWSPCPRSQPSLAAG